MQEILKYIVHLSNKHFFNVYEICSKASWWMKPNNIYRGVCVCVPMCTRISFVLVTFVNHFFELMYSTVARQGLHNATWSPCLCSLGNCTLRDICCAADGALGSWELIWGLMGVEERLQFWEEKNQEEQGDEKDRQCFPVCVGNMFSPKEGPVGTGFGGILALLTRREIHNI